MSLEKIEKRFLQVTSASGDLTTYPIKDDVDFLTDKQKSKDFAEVFTPLKVVDEMISTIPRRYNLTEKMTVDLCAGHGQFTVRMLRSQAKKKSFDTKKFLKNHWFCELQLESCFKLLYVFGGQTNLAIGDANELSKIKAGSKGIWLWLGGADSWFDVTKIVKALLNRKKYSLTNEANFCRHMSGIITDLERVSNVQSKQALENLLAADTKETRDILRRWVKNHVDKDGINWQDQDTPLWVAREMVASVPNLHDAKRILVMFNLEFLEVLIKDFGVDPERVIFGCDTTVEGKLAARMHKVDFFKLGQSMTAFNRVLGEKSGETFDVVFSNPPYQESYDGGNNDMGTKPIYNKIIESTLDKLNPRYACFITPSRWMAGGRGLSKFRDRMMNDTKVRLIRDFPGSKSVFKNVDIAGGVSYFLWDREYDGPCDFNGAKRFLNEFDVIVRDDVALGIIKKAKSNKSCAGKVLPQKPFGMRSNFNNWATTGVPVMRLRKEMKYTDKKNVSDKFNVLDKWKVTFTKAMSGGDMGNVRKGGKNILQSLSILPPGTACTQTYLVGGNFDTEEEAKNYLSYVKTKFFRYLVLNRLVSNSISKDSFSWVPDLQDYSKPWTDEELYKKFNLTEEEIQAIEKSIREM